MNLHVALAGLDAPVAGSVRESAHAFGDGLVGILSHPATPAPRATALILLNAGMVHRVGPFRGYVQLARVLADAGFVVLRFDQPGLGDSAAPVAADGVREAAIRAAMALVTEQAGVSRFVLGGICSAADDAFNLSDRDRRIVGLLLLDGLAYPTPGFWIRHVVPRVLDPRRVWRRVRAMFEGRPSQGSFRDFPPQAVARGRLGDLVVRDVRMLFLYTGAVYRYFNHRGQLANCLGRAARAPQVSLEYWPDCDHTFYLRRDRQRLQAVVLGWMHEQFGH